MLAGNDAGLWKGLSTRQSNCVSYQLGIVSFYLTHLPLYSFVAWTSSIVLPN